jgi:hypothetical protein
MLPSGDGRTHGSRIHLRFAPQSILQLPRSTPDGLVCSLETGGGGFRLLWVIAKYLGEGRPTGFCFMQESGLYRLETDGIDQVKVSRWLHLGPQSKINMSQENFSISSPTP